MPESVRTRIAMSDFFSVDNFKAEFLAQAKAMFGPGFVWLVIDNTADTAIRANPRNLYILRTYGSGSPLSGAQFRAQFEAGALNLGEKASKVARKITGGRGATIDVTPLLCVSMWEHSYIPDYTVHGKEAYLEAWWNKINWGRVAEISEIERVERMARSRERSLFHQTSTGSLYGTSYGSSSY